MVNTVLPPLIQQMLQPEFYSHTVSCPIKLIQTHISYVLLTGDYVYKVKKSVNFGFLDFTTLEQRGYFCKEELRLNRRLSPDLYLEVVAFGQRALGQFQILTAETPVDEAVEYAVLMRQFEQKGLFSRLLEQGKLTLDLMEELAKLMVAFHAIAATNPEIQSFGTVEALRQVDENNYDLSLPFVGLSQTQTQFDQTGAFTTELFDTHPDWFAQRQQEGKIRECHGDLHLNNVCLYHGKIQVFDCIEFNKGFRNIDVLYDVAFMVMDLEFQGRMDLANAFLNTYLEQTGDYSGAVLLPLYLSMRAYIRGNVNALALNEPSISAAEKQQFQERATAYYRWAWRYTQRQQGHIFLMSGLSGSGKTTVARKVSGLFNAIHIRSDAVRKQLAGIPLKQRGDTAGTYGSSIYTPEITQKTYERLLELGILLVLQGFPVVLDAKYERQSLRQTVNAKAQTAEIPLQILYCTAPLFVLRERMQTRKGDISDATVNLLADQLKATELFTEAELAYVTSIYTDQDVDAQIRRGLKTLTSEGYVMEPI